MNILLKKIGMTQVKHEQKVLPVTLLWCEMLKVLAHKTNEKDGYSAMVVGFGSAKLKRWNKPQHYLFKDIEADATEKVYEVRSDEPSEIGAELLPSSLFPVGAFVDVSGNTIGRGFSGCMKRHNFSGLPASHGVSKAHRKAGSTGKRKLMSKVQKGKKMAGRYGNERVTIQNLKVLISQRMDVEGKEGCLIGVYGAVPGPANSLCYLKNAVKKGKRA